jgi:cyclohexyl-isocyanide hydratase
MMNRRNFQMAALAAILAATTKKSYSAPPAPSESATKPPSSTHDMSGTPAHWTGKEQIAMLLYPEFTALDLVGPQYMFANLMGATVHLAAKKIEPVMSDTRLAISPTITLDECPKDLDILFVPGGTTGTLAVMQDEETLNFLADRGARAKLVTSVCTGSLLLGAAGLLRGYNATSHWVTRDLLKHVGAKPVNKRVVRDRNRITGAGVTAGLDFGLAIVAQLRDRQYAEAVQLLAEYAPQPPFSAGSADTAPKAARNMMDDMFVGFVGKMADVAKRARRTERRE